MASARSHEIASNIPMHHYRLSTAVRLQKLKADHHTLKNVGFLWWSANNQSS